MGAVEFQPIKAGGLGAFGRRDKVTLNALQIGSRGLARGLRNPGNVRNRRGSEHRPVSRCQRQINTFPSASRGAFASGMAQLQRNLGVGACMHKVNNAFPGHLLFVVPHSRAGWRDARVGRNAGHLHHNHSRAAHGAASQMNQVKVVGNAILRHVGGHRRHDHAILEG